MRADDMEPLAHEGDEPFDAADSSLPVSRWLMAAALLGLNLLDVLVTKWILQHGGTEMNPVMRPLIHDTAAPLVVKLLVATLVGVLLLASPRHSRFADRAMAVVVVAYAVVVAWNIGILLQAAQA